ncbi:MAG TPA: SIMPL domain-containing protein [Solirubrobacterales bacterium]|nr:SIMPL domain-containing protein [Solirubrobacterales bacterium]
MSSRVRKTPLIACLALALLVPSAAGAQERTIVVRGEATQEVPNDTASLGFSVTKERRSRAAALRIVAIRLQAVIAVVQTIPGVGPGDVTTGQITVRKVSGRGERPLFRASESVTVILHEPERAGELVSAAIAAGATGSRGPNFFAGDPEVAYNNTLLAAFDQAKAKAAALATRAGAILGPVISIEEGAEVVPSQPTTRRAPEAVSAPAPPTKPGGSTVTATVRVVFELQ